MIKNKIVNTLVIYLLFSIYFHVIIAQPIIHSHNDYFQKLPLYTAVSSGANSIEIDVIYQNGKLNVAHDLRDLPTSKTIEVLYFSPLVELSKNSKVSLEKIQLMIDIKNEPQAALTGLIKIIEELPDFKSLLQSNRIKSLVISGSKPSSYFGWPDYILFDHQSIENLNEVPMDKVAFFSFSFRNFSNYRGKGKLTAQDEKNLADAISKVHSLNKKIRFWASPDTKSAWYSLYTLGADYINTDKPWECSAYINGLVANVVKRDKSQKSKKPATYLNEKILTPSQNIILMIGDGNGLGHIAAAYTSQFGNINIAKSKHIGLIHTNSFDDLTTDSAAGGTALACGQKTKNRHIGVSPTGERMDNIFEKLPKKYTKIILTTDEITGATPSAFYAHVQERDDINSIRADLIKSNIDLIVGSGKQHFIDVKTDQHVLIDTHIPANFNNGNTNIIALDSIQLLYKSQGRGEFLCESFNSITAQLEKNKKPFFFVIENSHIDVSGHGNSSKDVISEVLDFDKCVGLAIDFAKKTPNTTLIVLADHETGGITLPHGNDEQMEFSFSTDDHTFLPVPVFTWGPNASIFQGMYQNTDIYHKILNILNLK